MTGGGPLSLRPSSPRPEFPLPPRRVTLVLGTTAGGTGAHVRMLAAGLAARDVAVSVAGPSSADARLRFSALPSVSFSPVEIGDRPRPVDLASILRLRGLLAGPGRGASPGGPAAAGSPGTNSRATRDGGHVVHAHGLRAGALTLLALTTVRGKRRPMVVVTVHNAPPSGDGPPALVYQFLERIVARRADLVLCVSPDLEARMRTAGARRVDRAVVAAPDTPSGQPVTPSGQPVTPSGQPVTPSGQPVTPSGQPDTPSPSPPVPPVLSVPEGRPVVLGVGRLASQKGFGVLLEAAVAWRDLDPLPLVVIAGDGPLGRELLARATALGVDAVFAGHRDDIPALLAAAAVFVLPSHWEGQPLVLQEALRAGIPVVATRSGGIPGLTGDAALLIAPGDARALAAAVRSVLTDPLLAAALRVAAASRATSLPSPTDAVDAALAAYAMPGS